MRQPANFDMFYGLSDSRTWVDKAKLPKKPEQMAKEKLEIGTKKCLTAPNAALRGAGTQYKVTA
ncbi:hypothetical protein CGJ37_23930 [Vibrio parahaemolyticus]|nr:hypothetical protein CGJ92_24950 [Vibrio parahaemolyticus]TOE68795.1 hypothetical protein CGJ37_23930 [Vibrio parahaemolyticus]